MRTGGKLHQQFEESECISSVIQDHGRMSLPENHSKTDQPMKGLWNSAFVILK